MELVLNPKSIADYRRFLAVKSLPKFSFSGECAVFPSEYANRIGVKHSDITNADAYAPLASLFDYQRDIAALAIKKRKYAIFADCGLGKTLMMLEYAKHAQSQLADGRNVLIVSPLMVVGQTVAEFNKFYGDGTIQRVRANELAAWASTPTGKIGITNYEALTDAVVGDAIGALILDESSMLKSHYGEWGAQCIRLGKGLDWKLCLTGTPAPNDRIEYANHAVFLDQFPTVNSFLARYFINRGQTNERWELKPHAIGPFYKSLSSWCIFVSNPSVYGWKDNCKTLPPIRVHIHEIPMTTDQREAVGDLQGTMFVDQIGGIGQRAKLSRLAKGDHNGTAIATNKPAFIKALVESWPTESTLIWCTYNSEQELMERTFPGAASIKGDTPEDERIRMIEDFKAGRVRILISKPKILGFGLNLQIATRQVFSGLQDSYEQYYQAVKRSNRVGSTKPLDVHIPITEIEAPMVETVLRKAKMVETDTTEQQKQFIANRSMA